jgi:two-component system sensor histidine kinase KdpD
VIGKPWAGYVVGALGTATTTGVLVVVSGHTNVTSLAVCYQLVVLAVSGLFGASAGLATSVASVLAFNWFFLPPVHTFTIADSRNWVALGVFAATALITSQLAGGFRRQRQEAEERERDAQLLAELARSALTDLGPGTSESVMGAAAARALGVQRCVIVRDGRDTGSRAVRLSASEGGFAIPLMARGRPLGLLEVGSPLSGQEPRWRRPGFAAAVAGLVALALERGELLAQALQTESLRRSDELKTALLQGVSHEFRSPLTAIRTASEALSEAPDAPDAPALLRVMAEETDRLERLVANLLDLSRLEAGAISVRLDWCAPVDLVAEALEAARPLLGEREPAVSLPDDLPLVRADALLCERILVNLLHNAALHGRPPVSLGARAVGDRLELVVSDAGPGVDPELAPRVFDAFVAGSNGGGTGVGLALARGLAEAQGGTLRLETAPRGARFVLSLPLGRVPEVA